MASLDLCWIFLYPALLLSVLGFRLFCAMQNPDTQASRKVAQASYWGEYASSNKNDKTVMSVPSVEKPPEPSPQQGSRGIVVWHH